MMMNPITMNKMLNKYKKMKEMFPEGVIRQRMTVDGFSSSEIDAFLNGTDPAPAPAAPMTGRRGLNKSLEKYETMRKMLPEGAVRQKMSVDGFTSAEIDSYFQGTQPASTEDVISTEATGSMVDMTKPSAPLPADKLHKYLKMKELFSSEILHQKMTVDGLSHDEIETFMKDGILPSRVSLPVDKVSIYKKMLSYLPEKVVRQRMFIDGNTLPFIKLFIQEHNGNKDDDDDDDRFRQFSKYIQMKSLFSEEIVRQKMTVDGFPLDVIDDFLFFDILPKDQLISSRHSPPAWVVYEKMGRMLPEGAVRQRMTVDGLSSDQIDFALGLSQGDEGGH